jgi:uncharacterized protein YwgA
MKVLDKKRILLIIAKLIQDLDLAKLYNKNSMGFKVIVQKLGYLVQKVGGIDFDLKFEWLSRGPYSRSLQNYYHVILHYISNYPNDFFLNEAENLALNRVKDFLNIIRVTLGKLDIEVIEAVASLIMLCTDVYPTPENPIDELLKRKRLSKEIALKIFEIVKMYGVCT